VDWVVIDSYSIPALSISELNSRVPCLALIDGDDRGISAHLYVDSNLDAEKRSWPEHIRSRLLAGADFALVREAVLAERRPTPWVIHGAQPQVVAFMGGTDPHNAISMVARALLGISPAPHVTLVVAESSRQETADLVAGRDGFSVVDATEKLPQIMARADVVVSAAGTSAWDLCALGVPSILIGLVENQSAGLRAAVDRGLVLGWDSHENLDSISRRLGPELERLLSDEELRRELSERSTATFDGRGSTRVVAAMEDEPSHAAPRD
jgi:spore coat polysaccharide biosynthesis predicted glycosyltransferase SpsG